MKITVLTSIFIVASILAGCKKSPVDPLEAAVPISLGAVVTSSKSAVVSGDRITVSVVGWESAAGLMPDYGKSNWISSAELQVSDQAQGIVLNEPQYYNPQPQYKTYIKAAHPVGVIGSDGVLTFANSESLRSGSVDVMVSDVVSGSREDASVKNLSFTHLLSQIRFEILAHGTFDRAMILKSITIEHVQFAGGIDFKSNSLVCSQAEDFPVSGISGQEIFDPTTPLSVGDPVMLKPFGSNKFTAVIWTELDGEPSSLKSSTVEVTIDNDTQFVAGKVYTVTLKRVDESWLTVDKVAILDWSAVNGGSIVLPI